jgi:hypothetical protein
MNEYYTAMDRYYGKLQPSDAPQGPEKTVEISKVGPLEIGTSTNPMQHQVQAFAAKIREGAGKIELSFLGAGKSNSQQPSPEAFGALDRQDIRAMAEINNINTSVHAALHGESLAGLGREGFSGEARAHALKEIYRAIQFASEATKGGAIVFHTGEWMRPMDELNRLGPSFKGYDDEEKKAPKIIVDSRTGEINAVRKDHLVYEPKFYTAKEYESVIKKKLVGIKDKNGELIESDDWVDIEGNAIKREWILKNNKVEQLFNRIPVWSEKETKFEVVPVTFADYEKQAAELRAKGNEFKDITPEELFFKSNIANQVLQFKGNSLYHAQRYDELKRAWLAANKAQEYYKKLEGSVPKDEQWKLMHQDHELQRYLGSFAPSESKLPSIYLAEQVKSINDQMRHIHESSASADAQAKQALDKLTHVQSIEKYGLDKTADTIAKAGMKAREYTESHKSELKENIYAAPENYRPEQYGSHPDEIRRIITASRKHMADDLVSRHHMDPGQAKKEAEKYIKATVDIGHMNLFRQFFQGKEGESVINRNKRFDKWILDETEKLAKEGILGHIHVTDNFGFDDEHITPGQGNVPMKEFLKRMANANIKDFIVEAGSFNGQTAMPDTWNLIGSPVYGVSAPPRTWRGVHHGQFGYQNPAQYIVGSYAPSNEWVLWSEVPME